MSGIGRIESSCSCRIVYDKTNEIFILCDLNIAEIAETIAGPFSIPACIDDGEDEEFEDEEEDCDDEE